MADILYIVVPCYNEEDVLPETSRRLKEKLTNLIEHGLASEQSRIMFVDDGSTDSTWSFIEQSHRAAEIFSGLKLSLNRGHQNALLAGLMTAMSLADVTVSLDADLQDDIGCLDEFMWKYYDGCDIVYGVRADRTTDSFFKRWSAHTYYNFMKKLGVQIIYNHADYRLMSRRALLGLSEFREVNLFLRGMIPLLGYKTGTVEYTRKKRLAGTTKYPLRKMFSFAWEGISSFTVRPIRYITVLGVVMLLGSVLGLIYTLCRNFSAEGISLPSVCLSSIWFIGSLQLLAISLVGEYVGKTYMEVKKRPRYIVEKILDEALENKQTDKSSRHENNY